MKRVFIALFTVIVGTLTFAFKSKDSDSSSEEAINTFYDFKTETLMGESFDFAQLKGKKVLIVNTASKCGYTYQYKELQELYDQYKDQDFEIIGFPSNQFGFQEPGSDEKIADFCEKNYGVSFPMMSKSDVKGKDQNALYAWLTHKDQNGVEDSKVSWNFNKFLVNEKGEYVAHYGSKTSPLDAKIVGFIQN